MNEEVDNNELPPPLPPLPDILPIPEFSKEDWLRHLTASGKNKGVINRNDKAKLLSDLFDSREEIGKRAESMDRDNTRAHRMRLKELFVSSLPTTKNYSRNDFTNKVLANMLYLPKEPIFALLQYIRQKRTSRRQLASHLSAPPDNLKILLEKYEAVMLKVESLLVREYNDKLKIPNRPDVPKKENEKPFDPSRVPETEAYRRCLFCQCPSINVLYSDEEIKTENDKIIQEYMEKLKMWNDHLEKKGKGQTVSEPIDPTTGKKMTRAPAMKKTKHNVFVCKCWRSRCVAINSDVSSTCPIKCRDENGKRYCLDQNGLCTCKTCRCKCSEAYSGENIERIKYAVTARMNFEVVATSTSTENNATTTTNATANNNNTPRYENDANRGDFASFFMGCSEQALQEAAEKARDARENMRNRQTQKELQDEVDLTIDSYYENVAMRIAQSGHDQIRVNDKKEMQEQFKMKTLVTLSNGHQYDTRNCNVAHNKHARNNRLAGLPESTPFKAPGMLSRLLIDHPKNMMNDDNNNNNNNPTSSSSSRPVFVSPKPTKPFINVHNEKPSKPEVINLFDSSDEDMEDLDVKPAAEPVKRKEKYKKAPTTPPTTNRKRAIDKIKKHNSEKMLIHKDDNELNDSEMRMKKLCNKVGKHIVRKGMKNIVETAELMDLNEENADGFSSKQLWKMYYDQVYSDEE